MKQVYICFSTDIIHNGHLSILKKAAALGEVTVGILTDEVVASYKHYPLIPLDERITMFESLKYVSRVVVQEPGLHQDPQSDSAGYRRPWR